MEISNRKSFLERTAHYWFLAVPTIIGVGIFIAGFFENLAIWKEVLFSVGGTIFGSSLGTALGLIAGEKLQRQVIDVKEGLEQLLQTHSKSSKELHQQLSDTLSKAVQFPWSTDEAILKAKRTVQHLYYRTRIGGQEFWMYLILDFSKQFEPGRLYCKYIIPMAGKEYMYEQDGLLADTSLVLITKSEHGEPDGIITIRNYGIGLGVEGYWGLYFHMDWDTKDGVDPCILTDKQFNDTGQQGQQTTEFGKTLEKKWLALAPETGQAIIGDKKATFSQKTRPKK